MRDDEDRFFKAIGKIVCVGALIVCTVLVMYSLRRLYQADQEYLHDETPLLPPDSTKKEGK